MFHLVYSVNAAPSPVFYYLAVPPPPSQVIHGDLAHYNLVAECDPETGRPTLVGVIDFGDVAEGWVMAELSTAIAALLAREDLSALEQVSEAKPAGGGGGASSHTFPRLTSCLCIPDDSFEYASPHLGFAPLPLFGLLLYSRHARSFLDSTPVVP